MSVELLVGADREQRIAAQGAARRAAERSCANCSHLTAQIGFKEGTMGNRQALETRDYTFQC
jgi:hypothetical protein